jgi:hypothetical protein
MISTGEILRVKRKMDKNEKFPRPGKKDFCLGNLKAKPKMSENDKK